MTITEHLRKSLTKLLPPDYRVVVQRRLRKRGIDVHVNTISNVLNNGSENAEVAKELLRLADERKRAQQRLNALAESIKES